MERGSSPTRPDRTGTEADVGVSTATELDPLDAAHPPSLRVLVTGGDGFVGRHLLPRLESRGHSVRATYRTGVGGGERVLPGAEWRRVDVTDPDTLTGLARECDVVVHLAGTAGRGTGASIHAVHVSGTRHVLAEARRSGVTRFVYLSALGASPTGGPYFRAKFEAESAVLSAELEHVILRAAVAYGPGDRFTTSLARLLHVLPTFPMLGDGTFQLQPVAVEDLTDALAQAVERPDVSDCVLEIGGPERLSFVRIVRTVGEVIGRPRPILPLPTRLAPYAVRLADRLGWPTPFTPQQLDVMREGAVLADPENPLRTVFRVKPLPFRDAVADYLASISGETGRTPDAGARP